MRQAFQISGPEQTLLFQIDGHYRGLMISREYNKLFPEKKYMSNRIGAINVDRLSFSARVGFPQLLEDGDRLDVTAVAIHNMLVGLAMTRADTSFTVPGDLKRFFEPHFSDYCHVVDWFEFVYSALVQGRDIPADNFVARLNRDRELADPATARYWARLAELTNSRA